MLTSSYTFSIKPWSVFLITLFQKGIYSVLIKTFLKFNYQIKIFLRNFSLFKTCITDGRFNGNYARFQNDGAELINLLTQFYISLAKRPNKWSQCLHQNLLAFSKNFYSLMSHHHWLIIGSLHVLRKMLISLIILLLNNVDFLSMIVQF